MSEPLSNGIKRIIWIASDKKHKIVGAYYPDLGGSFKEWKAWIKDAHKAEYITKHEVYL